MDRHSTPTTVEKLLPGVQVKGRYNILGCPYNVCHVSTDYKYYLYCSV